MNIFKALFGSKSKPTEEVKKDVTRDFNVLKYDGVRALRERQFDYAIQCLLRAIDMNGADLECRDYLSQAFIATDNLSQAYEQLQKMAEECPDNIAVLLRMADVAYMMENYTAMADVCEKAMMLDGDNVQVYFFYAKACCGHGDLTNAVVMLSKALMLNADFDAARLLRGSSEVSKLPSVISLEVWLLHVPLSAFPLRYKHSRLACSAYGLLALQ